jgi:hypothetical protein
MKHIFFTTTILAVTIYVAQAQGPQMKAQIDSIEKAIQKQQDQPKELSSSYVNLGSKYATFDQIKEEEYYNKALALAETTRDRPFMCDTYLRVAESFLNLSGQKQRASKAIELLDKALKLAKESQLNDKLALIFLRKASEARTSANFNDAVKFNQDAINYAEISNNDSIILASKLSYGTTLLYKDEDLSAFKKLSTALYDIESTNYTDLKKAAYDRLASFYNKIGQVEKAKDYYYKIIDLAKKENNIESEVSVYSDLIQLYIQNKDFANAREVLAKLKDRGKLLKTDMLKTLSLIMEVNILLSEDITKAPKYIKENPSLVTDLYNMGYGYEAEKVMGIRYSQELKKDSAEYYFKRAKELTLKNGNPYSMIGWNGAYINHLKLNKEYAKAVPYGEESLALAKQAQSLSIEKFVRTELDSLYLFAGNSAKRNENLIQLYQIKDSLEKQQKAKE